MPLGIAAAGVVGLAALGAARGLWKPPVPAAQAQQISVTLRAEAIDPAVMLLLPGPVRFMVRNASAAPRALRITGPGVHATTDILEAGGRGALDVTFRTPGIYHVTDGRGRAAEGTIQVRQP